MAPANNYDPVILREDAIVSISRFLDNSDHVQPKGMAHKSYFFSPSFKPRICSGDFATESGDDGIKMCRSLYSYLLRQGYKKEQLIILTTDRSQASVISCMKSEKTELEPQIETINKFTFEENGASIIMFLLLDCHYYEYFEDGDLLPKIVDLLFLMTQPNASTIGLYIIGDEHGIFAIKESTALIAKLYKEKKLMGSTLRLKCSTHGTEQCIRSAEDFPLNGGCYNVCLELLPCGHSCSELCHPSFDHDKLTICSQACGKPCEKGHLCQAQCHPNYQCEPCRAESLHKFPICGHTVSLICCEIATDGLPEQECKEFTSFSLPCRHELKFKCSELTVENIDNIAKTHICQRFVLKYLPCGHPKALRCHQSLEGAKCLKTVSVVKSLECGHYLKGTTKCYKRESISKKVFKKKCKPLCTKKLSCGHPCYFETDGSSYGDDLETDSNHERIHPCMHICRRKCIRQHECGKKHPCRQPCPPCKEDTHYAFSRCNHRRSVPCHDFNKEYAKHCDSECSRHRPEGCDHPCPIPCQDHFKLKGNECPPCNIMTTKTRDCKHTVMVLCGEGISVAGPCQEICDIRELSLCDHPIPVRCHQVADIKRSGTAHLYCKSRCNFYFDPELGGCGHNCEGCCSECAVKRFHESCSKKCGKLQLCGHECKEPCSSTCPPCEQNCENSCDHGPCKHICALPCAPCWRPCSYSCLHGKCTMKCGELCDKKPCMEHCSKKMLCGHLCIGYCGEPCPPLCAICDKGELLSQDLLGNTSIDAEKDRFILLVDCGHTVNASSLELLMTVDTVEGQILPKKCPICRKDIRNCNRFKTIVLKIREDIEMVKRKIYGNIKDIRQKQEDAMSYVYSDEIKSEELFKNLKDRIIKELMMSSPFGFSKGNFQKMPIGKAECLAFVAELYAWSVRHLDEMKTILPTNLYSDLELTIQQLLEIIEKRYWPLTAFELKSIRQEWERIIAVSTLYRKKGTTESEAIKNLLRQKKGKEAFEHAVWIATRLGIFNESRKMQLNKAMKTLEAALECKLDVTDAERKSIVSSFGMSPGRWFKCQNLHPYIVEECGAPTQESACNICGARIGGTRHRVLPSNDLASEMDGAVEPLYPTALTGGDLYDV